MSVDNPEPCRTCLTEGGQMKDLFSETHVPRLDMMLMSSTQLEVYPVYGLPRVICVSCSDKLYNSYMFKKMCYESEAILKKRSTVNVSKEQRKASVEEHNSSSNCVTTNNFTEAPVIDIPDVIKAEPSELETSGLDIDALQDYFGNGECGADSDESNRDASLKEIIVNLPVRASRKKKKYECSKCSGKFKNRVQYQNHYCSDVRFTCTECNKSYASQVKLERHTKLAHDKDLNDSSDLTSIVSGLLELKYTTEKDQILNLKEEILMDECEIEGELPSSKEDNDNKPCSPGPSIEVSEKKDSAKESNTPKKKKGPLFTGVQNTKDGTFTCKYCVWETTRNELTLLNHIAREHGVGQKMFGCNKCGQMFTSKSKCARHRAREHKKPMKFYPCPHCGKKITTSEVNLINHMFREHGIGQRMFGCKACGQMFPSKTKCKSHRVKEHRDPNKFYICHHCGRKFYLRASIERHLKIVHAPKNGFKCRNKRCAHVLPTKEELDQHMLEGIHSESMRFTRYFCDYCNKGFNRMNTLRRHILNVHMETLSDCIKCNDCKMSFNTRYGMRLHYKIHITDKSKACLCTECGKGFSSSSALRIHMNRHKGVKSHKCQYCDKTFVRDSDRQVHEKHHTNTYAHLCTTCGKGFVRRCSLTVHMRSHTGDKPFKCTFCDWKCSQANDLKTHIRRHTGERFTCDLCSKDFLQVYQLKNHKLSEHGVLDPKITTRVKKVKETPPKEG